jgi:hypothetical protein
VGWGENEGSKMLVASFEEQTTLPLSEGGFSYRSFQFNAN